MKGEVRVPGVFVPLPLGEKSDRTEGGIIPYENIFIHFIRVYPMQGSGRQEKQKKRMISIAVPSKNKQTHSFFC